MPDIVLRRCQTKHTVQIVTALQEWLQCFGVLYGTGGGKTLLSLAVAAKAIQMGTIDRVLILAPSTAIVEHFLRFSERMVHPHPAEDSFEPFSLGVITGVVDGEDLTRRFSSLTTGDARPRIIVTTHAMFAINSAEDSALMRHLSADRRTLVVVDEAQSCPWLESRLVEATTEEERSQYVLGRAITRLRTMGFAIGKLSGSPTRSDGLDVFRDGDLLVEQTLHQLMFAGLCPQVVRTEIVHVDGLSESDSDSYLVPIDPKKGAAEVDRIWAKYDRIPGCTRIKPRRQNENSDAIEALLEIPRVIDTSGAEALIFDSALAYEALAINDKTAIYEDYQTMFVGMVRIVTGIDSPSRALGILYGIPRSLVVLLQFLGRILRLKTDSNGIPLIAGYPSEWLNRVQLVFLVGGLPSEADRKEEHLGVLFQAFTLTESLNYAAMFGQLFRRFYDGMSPGPGPGPREPKAPDPDDLLGLASEENTALLARAEIALIGLSGVLDDMHYMSSPPYKKLRLVKGWLRAKARIEAEAEGLDPDEVKAKVDAEVAVHLPVMGALLTIRVASKPENLGRSKKVLDGVMDKAIQEQLLALYEEFKEQAPETEAGYVLEPTLLQYLSERAAFIGAQINKPPAPPGSIEIILERIQAYRDLHDGRYPSLEDTDPLSLVGVKFSVYDKLLRSGHYPEFRGGLGELLTSRETTPWWEDARGAEKAYQWVQSSSPKLLKSLRAEGPDKFRRMQRVCSDRVVACYYPQAIRVASAQRGQSYICSEEFLQALTPPEANWLGGRSGLSGLLGELQHTFDQAGIQAVRERLAAL